MRVRIRKVHTATEQDRRAIASALDLLGDEQRVLLHHAYFNGLSPTELVRHFGLPLGTVTTRMRKGLLFLQQQLQRGHLNLGLTPSSRSSAPARRLASAAFAG